MGQLIVALRFLKPTHRGTQLHIGQDLNTQSIMHERTAFKAASELDMVWNPTYTRWKRCRHSVSTELSASSGLHGTTRV